MNRGGKREGAGRPALSQTEKRVNFTCQVSPATIQRIALLKDNGITIGKMLDEHVAHLVEEKGLEK